MQDIAGWVALAATCIGALMTAANLGARVTGWGFVVFTVGAAAWIVVGAATGQTQLLWSNIFLGLVDLFGIWRWLGHRAKIQDTSKAEEARSRRRPGDDLFALSKLDGLPVTGREGAVIAHAVDALTQCNGGEIAYLIVREGGVVGVGETLRRLPWGDAKVRGDTVTTELTEADVGRLPRANPA